MTFREFNRQIQNQFDQMQQYKLFRLNCSGQQIWDTYLAGFTREEDPVFRDPQSSTHTCNNDKNFIRRYGNVVAIDKDYNLMTLFDIDVTGSIYENTVKNLRKFLQNYSVSEVFFETYDELNSLPYEKITRNQSRYRLGHEKSLKRYSQEEVNKFGVVNTTDVYTFYHFHVLLDKRFVQQSRVSIESIMASYRDAKTVFERGLSEISLDTFELVKDLVLQGSLLNADQYFDKLERFIEFKKQYDNIPNNKQNNWLWVNSYDLPFAKFRNELLGTLCVELTEGKDLNQACLEFNKRADPSNYMKAKAPITQHRIDEANNFVQEQGYADSFQRRFATLSDIKLSEIKHMNVDENGEKPVGLFAGVQPSKPTQHKRSQFDGIQEVSIGEFMQNILPRCTSVELFLENRHQNNFVSLITTNKDSKPIFKWSNNFSWTYRNNLTGKSEIKESVKVAGGNIEGVLRCSLAWNESGKDQSDLDLWCVQPNNEKIGFNSGFRKDQNNRFSSCSGQLDLDEQFPGKKLAVENIYFTNIEKLKTGQYLFQVNQFADINSLGFKAEIEFDGQIYSYEYPRPVVGRINVATVTFKDGRFSIEHHLPELNQSKKVWGLESNKFHKVNLVCLSPNHWGDNNIGNKHYFFMLDKCASDEPLRSFHNEYLNGDLLNYRKVLEVLADTTRIAPTKPQLAGLGFNATVKDSVILKLKGSFERVVKVTT